jgi:hypothetical protein
LGQGGLPCKRQHEGGGDEKNHYLCSWLSRGRFATRGAAWGDSQRTPRLKVTPRAQLSRIQAFVGARAAQGRRFGFRLSYL